ncbi:hypothetical protein PG984_015468 [Apiospora sp. TS-2023a]
MGDYPEAHVQFNKALDFCDVDYQGSDLESPKYVVDGDDNFATNEEADEIDMVFLARAKTDFLWGNYKDALEDAEKAYRGLKARWGNESLKTMICAPIYGLLLALRSQVQEGLYMCESALDAMNLRLGPEHPDTLEARYYLVQIYIIQYRLVEAAPHARFVSETTAASIGRQTPHAVRADTLLAAVSMATGEYASAERDLREIVERAKDVFGISHPETLQYQSVLANGMFQAAKYSEALEYIKTTFCSLMCTCFAYSTRRLSENTRHLTRVPKNWTLSPAPEKTETAILDAGMKAIADVSDDTTINFCVFSALELIVLAGSDLCMPEYYHKNGSVFQALWAKVQTQKKGSYLLGLSYAMKLAMHIPESLNNKELHDKYMDSLGCLKEIHEYKSRVFGKNNPSTLLVKRELIKAWCNVRKFDEGSQRRQREVLQEIIDIHEAELGWNHTVTVGSLLWLFVMKIAAREVEGLPAMLDDALARLRNESARQERFATTIFYERGFANAITRGYPAKVGQDLQMRALEIFCEIETAIAAKPPSFHLHNVQLFLKTNREMLCRKSANLQHERDRLLLEVDNAVRDEDHEMAEKTLETLCKIIQLLNGVSHPATVEAQLRLASLKIRFKSSSVRRD